ncbi:MAG: VOC family protein [Gemmatimonadota bacterium]
MNHQDTSGGGRRSWPTGLRWSVAGAALSAMLVAGAACSGSIEVPALNPTPTGQYHTGQVVWHDLVTPDVESAKKFYGGLFGWTFQTIESNGIEYAIAMIGPRPVAGFYRPEDKTYSAAEWLQFFSVDDVDAAVARVATAGGTMIAEPDDIPQRGRLAVVEDREGAAFGLIRSASGDPAAGISSPHNDFLWNELWTNDMAAAGSFYEAAVELDSRIVPRENGDYLLFTHGGERRAGGLEIPQANIEPTWIPTIRVADIKATVARAKQLGGEIALEPRWDLVDGKVAIIVDPNGAPVTVRQWEGQP